MPNTPWQNGEATGGHIGDAEIVTEWEEPTPEDKDKTKPHGTPKEGGKNGPHKPKHNGPHGKDHKPDAPKDTNPKEPKSKLPKKPKPHKKPHEWKDELGGTLPNTLILYDTAGPYAFMGDAFAQLTANLVSHFGPWKAMPVKNYTAQLMENYHTTIYIGSTYDEPLPAAFLEDARSTARQVVWINNNIWQLTAEMPDFKKEMGWMWTGFDVSPIHTVTYRGANLQRAAENAGGIMGINISDASKAEEIATAWKSDNTTKPWAVKSDNFIYISEVPYCYMGMNDRYLAWCDMLYTLLAPNTPERHRAMIRIEDVGPEADPDDLKAICDVLYSRGIPFSIACFPYYHDPKGVYNEKVPLGYALENRSLTTDALKNMARKGGTLLMHGFSHQFRDIHNPYSGVSGEDFEFFATHVSQDDYVIYDGPVLDDSTEYAVGRMKSAAYAFQKAGFKVPTIFEPPHYAASTTDYLAIASKFGRRYDRGTYFPGLWSNKVDHTRPSGQFFPYLVKDVYGSKVVPENIGNIEPEPFNHHPARLPVDLLETARLNKLAIRDGFASFFYHTYLGTDYLVEMVDGLKEQGWEFVAPMDVKN